MNRSRSQLDSFQHRHRSLHKPGVVPHSSRRTSPILSNVHKYELKQKIWPKQTVESWFQHHSPDDRRAVYSFLNTLYMQEESQKEDKRERSPVIKQSNREEKCSNTKVLNRENSFVNNNTNHLLQRRVTNSSARVSRASKRDLGEVLESLESFRPSFLTQEKGIQTSATPITVGLPNIKQANTELPSKPPQSSMEKYREIVPPANTNEITPPTTEEENSKIGRRYLSPTWRVINPRDDMEPSVRPENNSSSFFNYTKKVYPEYFFIHPDWY